MNDSFRYLKIQFMEIQMYIHVHETEQNILHFTVYIDINKITHSVIELQVIKMNAQSASQRWAAWNFADGQPVSHL
jgi:hypothetical protein